MNTFEEHQLFIPIINDGRFAVNLADQCHHGRRVIFNRYVLEAVHKIRVENNLSISVSNRETVQQELWEYYKRREDEERAAIQAARDNAVYAAEGFDAKPNQAERELSDWKQSINRTVRATDDVVNALNHTHTQPKESPIMATPTFVTITYVSGKPLNELTNDDLINAIKACEKEIESLREVKRTSTKVAAKIAELDSTADKIRDALDARA